MKPFRVFKRTAESLFLKLKCFVQAYIFRNFKRVVFQPELGIIYWNYI